MTEELSSKCRKFAVDLAGLSEIKVNRKVLTDGEDVTLAIITDASKTLYGFSVYSVVEGERTLKSSLLFSKSKVAPSKSKSLSTLELLAVYLVFKCLDSVLGSLTSVTIRGIYFCIDAQIMPSWILAERVKTKLVCKKHSCRD